MATSFNLGGLLGLGGNELDDLLSPEQRASINQRGLLSAAAALLQAGGPSTRRVSLGQALGSALEAGQTGSERAQQSALTQMLTRQKLEEATGAKDLRQRIANILAPTTTTAAPAGGEITADEALAASGMAAGPTVARAAMIGQPRPAAPEMSANEMRAQQYRRVADVYAASGRGEDAKRFMDIAENLAPTRQEVVGEPIQTATGWVQRTKSGGFIPLPRDFEPAVKVKPVGEPTVVTDQKTNNQILVQRFDDGTIKTVEGFGPKRDIVLQQVDGRTVAIDKANVVAGQEFGTGRDLRTITADGKTQVVDFSKIEPGTTFGTGRDIRPVTVDGRTQFVDMSTIEPGTVLGTGRDIRPITVDGKTQFVDVSTVAPGTVLGTGRDIRPITVDGKTQLVDFSTAEAGTTFGTGRDLRTITVDGKTQVVDFSTLAPGTTFGTGRDIRAVNVDGRTQLVDFSTAQPGTTFGTGISPIDQARLDIEKQRLDMERRRLGISEAEFARNAYDRVETAQGIVYVPKRPGAPIIPITDAAGKPLMGGGSGKPTEGETNAAGFAQRMERSQAVISGLPQGSQPGVRAAVAGALPVVGGVAQRRAMTAEQQQYKQAADDWIRAKLRKESGAAIGVDEMQKEYETYFPQIGDTPEVIAQKAGARAIATNAMKTSAGNSYRPYVPPSTEAPKDGDTAKDRSGRNIVFRNGRWEYQ